MEASMKKHLRFIGVALFMAMLVLSGCQSTKAVAPVQEIQTEPVSGSVVSLDKYGNATLSVTPADFTDKGYAVGDLFSVSVGDFSFDAPLVTNYSDVDNGSFLIREKAGDPGTVSLAINMGNFSKTSGAQETSPVSFTLKEKEGYLKEYQIRQLKKSENRDDYASDAVFSNFRTVTVGKIAPGTLYRSCNPVLGDARAPYAAELAQQAGVKTIINLADSTETLKEHIADSPYYQQLYNQGAVIVLDMGVSFTDPDFIAKLHDGLVFMANHGGPYLVHCNEGKDRAGFVSALLEAANGATLEEITQDYMVSFENYYGVQPGTEQYELIGKTITDMFTQLNGGKPVTDKTIAKVANAYLKDTVGLDQATINQLNAHLQGK